jgi:hypothetical protein
VLKNGAPDCPMCHRTVSGAPGLYRCQPATLGKMKARSAIIHRTVRCAIGLSGEPGGNDYPAPMVDCKSTCHMNSATTEVRAVKSEGIRLSGMAPDCPVPQEDKAPTVDFAPNPNGWVMWRRTGQRTVPVQWRTGLSGAPIASSLPNGYGSGWGHKYPQPPHSYPSKHSKHCIQYNIKRLHSKTHQIDWILSKASKSTQFH